MVDGYDRLLVTEIDADGTRRSRVVKLSDYNVYAGAYVIDVEGQQFVLRGMIKKLSVNSVIKNEKYTYIDISGDTLLTELDCDNGMTSTSIDVSKNTSLERLSLVGNQLTALDVSKNTALNNFSAARNANITSVRTATSFANSGVTSNINSLITNATSTSGTLEYVPGGQYEARIKKAATDKGWTVKAIAG